VIDGSPLQVSTKGDLVNEDSLVACVAPSNTSCSTVLYSILRYPLATTAGDPYQCAAALSDWSLTNAVHGSRSASRFEASKMSLTGGSGAVCICTSAPDRSGASHRYVGKTVIPAPATHACISARRSGITCTGSEGSFARKTCRKYLRTTTAWCCRDSNNGMPGYEA